MTTTRTVAIVVTYNSADHIGRCLAALQAAGVAIRVVDNASVDGTADVIRRDFPAVDLIAGHTNVGFARAVNRAAFGVAAEVILLVNPDCVVPAGTTRDLVALLLSQPTVGIAGPSLVGSDGAPAVSAHPFETLHSVVFSRFGGSLLPVGVRRLISGRDRRRAYDACRASTRPSSVDWLSGACLAVRGDLFRDIGGLDERYFLYYEDEELCLQAKSRGARVVLLPTVPAMHIGGASSELGATWPHLYRSMLIFFARHRAASYQAVRFAVLVRAGLGVGLGCARRLHDAAAGRTRMAAWARVAHIAWSADRRSMAAQREPVSDDEGIAA